MCVGGGGGGGGYTTRKRPSGGDLSTFPLKKNFLHQLLQVRLMETETWLMVESRYGHTKNDRRFFFFFALTS